jgi:protein-S-isoprenylcysteine O-methyltransferase Ste14
MSNKENRVNFIHKIVTSRRKVRNLLTPVGFLFFFSLVTLIVLASLWLDRLLGFSGFMPEPWRVYLGTPIMSIGLFFMLWSVATFALARGTPVPFNPPPALVTRGPYAHARNPMLSGLFIALFGLGLLLDSITLAFIVTPLFVLLNVYEIKNIEEPELERRLGTPYIEYKSRVPRFWPRLTGIR